MIEKSKKNEPLVSVVIPAYNCEKFIGETVDSILKQTYECWELIVVDDGSEDNTLLKLRSYYDNRIRIFENGENRGISYTTNRGIKESHGEYIALLDHDDIAEADRLAIQTDYMKKHPEIDILGGRTTMIDEKGRLIERGCMPRNNPNYIKAILLFNCMDFMNGTVMIRKDFIDKHGLSYQENCYGMQDYKFYIDSSKVGKITTVNNFLLRHRLHENNETNKIFKLYKKERAQKYAQFQRDSLKASGYQLSEENLCLIHKALAECNGKCDTKAELKQLYNIFNEILQQGKRMNIEYFDELKHLCRMKIAEQITRMEIFDLDM